MTAWFNSISPTTEPAARSYFELELLYSYVYILSPNPRCPIISDYAQILIFEHCIAYASKILVFTSDKTRTDRPPLTFYDGMRVYMTGRQFVDTLMRNQDFLLSRLPSTPSAALPAVEDVDMDPLASVPERRLQPPPLPTPALNGNGGDPQPTDPAVRAGQAIGDFTSILYQLGNRFGVHSWRERFQRESAPLLSQLAQRVQQQEELEQGYCLWNTTGLTMPSATANPVVQKYNPALDLSYGPAFSQPGFDGGSARRGWTAMGSEGGGQRFSFSMAGQVGGPLAAVMPVATMDEMALGPMTAWETLPGGSLNARFA